MFRNRSASIQQALEEARAASQDANRRLADIENRLRQLDVEIGQMQAAAEKEADAEEVRIQKAAEDDIRKWSSAAEQEIAAAAKQARRELSTYTAEPGHRLGPPADQRRFQYRPGAGPHLCLEAGFALLLRMMTTAERTAASHGFRRRHLRPRLRRCGDDGTNQLDPARALQELHSIEALLKESDQLRRVLENPSIPGDRKRAVLDAITARLGTTRQVRNFVAVLTDHRRLPLFSEILKQVEQELNDRQGFAEAQVSSARQLSDPEKQMLEAEITKMTGKKVRARYEQDASLLGGAVVQVGSTIYDGSVKGQLERIREQLVEG